MQTFACARVYGVQQPRLGGKTKTAAGTKPGDPGAFFTWCWQKTGQAWRLKLLWVPGHNNWFTQGFTVSGPCLRFTCEGTATLQTLAAFQSHYYDRQLLWNFAWDRKHSSERKCCFLMSRTRLFAEPGASWCSENSCWPPEHCHSHPTETFQRTFQLFTSWRRRYNTGQPFIFISNFSRIQQTSFYTLRDVNKVLKGSRCKARQLISANDGFDGDATVQL